MYHSICTTSHATGSSHPCRHNGHGGPLESLKVRLTLPLARAEHRPTHTGRFGEARKSRSANDVVVCSWEVYVPRHTASMSSHFFPMQACVSRYASCEDCARPSATMGDVGKKHQPRPNTHETRHRFSWSYGRLLALRLEYIFLSIFQ